MSFPHNVVTALHSNIQVSLRRDGYPVTWADFQKAWALALPNIRSSIEKHEASLRVPLSVSRMEYVDALSAAAYFR
eukprot:15449616-Alexandrium_andersonii.AAC.1